MRIITAIIIFFFCITTSFASEENKFRITLSDKGYSPFSIDKPEQFLSKKSLDRRIIQSIAIDSTDLPISAKYELEIKNLGFKIIAKSKWFNTITVECNDSLEINKLKDLNYITDIKWVGRKVEENNKKSSKKKQTPPSKEYNYYGYAKDQIETVNGHKIHEMGYYGENMNIAVIDAGFENIKENLYLSDINIGGSKDFVNNGIDMYSSSEHGINVLSAMATNHPHTFVGTAPKAKYWLLRSEDNTSEYPVEEDYWVTAIEYADSIGIDIVNSSLGYQKYDYPAQSITYEEMDGKTRFITKAANLATKKGIFVVVSAGNEGNKDWEKITVPADAEDILTVGSMTKDSIISSFSSIGLTFDNRIKPDIVAMGDKINLIDKDGNIIVTNGTSFSTPVISGLAACLWQAYPKLKSEELLNIIRSCSSKYNKPNERYGYGAPDFLLAFKLAKDITTGIEEDLIFEDKSIPIFTYKSDSIGQLKIEKSNKNNKAIYYLSIYNLAGKKMVETIINNDYEEINISSSSRQLYILYIRGEKESESKKIFF